MISATCSGREVVEPGTRVKTLVLGVIGCHGHDTRGHRMAENALIIVSGNVYEEALAMGIGVVENGSRYIKHLLTNAKVRSIRKRNDAPLF